MSTRAILFDLDDTLVIEHAGGRPAFLAACELARERRGVDPETLYAAVLAHTRRIWYTSPTAAYVKGLGLSSWEGLASTFAGDDPNLAALRAWYPTFRREAWTAGLADCGVNDPTLAADLAEAYCAARRHHEVFPDALTVLESFVGRYPMTIVSNGVPDLQNQKLEATGLRHYFETVVVSSDVGIGKPDPKIFHRAIELLGVAASEVVMVGNSLPRDVGGAKRAGIRAIWLNRPGDPPDVDVTPDAEIRTLEELPAHL